MKNQIITVKGRNDIPERYRNTPIDTLFMSHNLGHVDGKYDKAVMLILKCMDNRQSLSLPENYAFIISNSGANRNGVTFSISFAIAVGGIRHVAVIGHSNCRMVNLDSQEAEFVKGLSEYSGWETDAAESLFEDSCNIFRKTDVVDSVVTEAGYLRARYPGIVVAPIYYSLDDDLLYLIDEST